MLRSNMIKINELRYRDQEKRVLCSVRLANWAERN